MGDFLPELGQYGLLYITIGVMLTCGLIYNIGHYNLLDKIMKILMLVLFIATLVAFVIALLKSDNINYINLNESPFNIKYLAFLLALMGWMPGPIEISVWQSLWIKAKERDTGQKYSPQMAKIDFNVGYILCIVLAVIFVVLGAIVMHGSGQKFSSSGVAFAGQLINLYSENIGQWAVPIISICALSTIFSTSLTLFDAYPRSLAVGFIIASNRFKNRESFLKLIISIVAGLFALSVIYYFINTKQGMTFLVDIVTIIAFITAPFFAFLNTKLVFNKKTMPKHMQPSLLMKCISIMGIIFLLSFVAVYGWVLIVN
jgi:Mn2+/Fe2+ NRAMP family transporter